MTNPIVKPIHFQSPPQVEDSESYKLAALANAEAQRLMSEGQGTSQMIVHYSSYSPEREHLRLEEQRLKNELLTVRVENERKSGEAEVSISEVLAAFMSYKMSP